MDERLGVRTQFCTARISASALIGLFRTQAKSSGFKSLVSVPLTTTMGMSCVAGLDLSSRWTSRPAQTRQHKVEDDRLRAPAFHPPQGVDAVFDGHDRITGGAQSGTVMLAKRRIILDHEDVPFDEGRRHAVL